MPDTHTCLHVHVVFSTRDRHPWLVDDVERRLWPYLGGVAKNLHAQPVAIGGHRDHVHILARIPATLTVAKLVQTLKANSSKWIHETFPALRAFAWQAGYGAFAVGVAQVDRTAQYIRNQHEHHRVKPSVDEYRAFLKKHGIELENL